MQLPRSLRAWLLRDADPSVQVRVLRDLLGRPANDPALVAAKRKVGREGWVKQILAEQLPGGQWATLGTNGRALYNPKYIAQTWRLIVLAELGASGRDPKVRRAVELFLRVWGAGPRNNLGGRDSEACFTGNAVRLLTLLGWGDDPRVHSAVDWIVRTQKPDGGWHCWRSRTGTLDAWEPLAGLSTLAPADRSAAVDRAVERGAEFFLDRGLLREGKGTYAPWHRLHFPTHYYYDLLVGLQLLTRLGYGDDRRLRRPLDLLEAKRNPDGTWNMDALHPDIEDPTYRLRTPYYPFGLEAPGRPSRWITTTALEVLQACHRM
jgi:hypothetical protein